MALMTTSTRIASDFGVCSEPIPSRPDSEFVTANSRELPWTAWVRRNTGFASKAKAVYNDDYAEVLANVRRGRGHYSSQSARSASDLWSAEPDSKAARKNLVKNMLRRERELLSLGSASGTRMNYLC